MRHRLVLGLLVVLAACGTHPRTGATTAAAVTPASAPAPDPAERLSHAARRALASLTTTRYAHRTRIDDASGTFVTDCSGFLSWLLRKELPDHLAAIPVAAGRNRPLARDYQEALSSGVAGWQRIPRFQDLRPGDVLAWRYRDPEPGRSTGHVMIVDSTARPAGDGILAVDVIDSTSVPHDDDSRAGTDGLGRGTIQIRVDTTGAPVAVRGNRRSPFRMHLISAARPVRP